VKLDAISAQPAPACPPGGVFLTLRTLRFVPVGGNGGIGGGGGGGEVLGISTLAATNNPLTRYQILLTIIVSIGLIIYGYKIQKNS
jgi:preprotein translocase subunit SecG